MLTGWTGQGSGSWCRDLPRLMDVSLCLTGTRPHWEQRRSALPPWPAALPSGQLPLHILTNPGTCSSLTRLPGPSLKYHLLKMVQKTDGLQARLDLVHRFWFFFCPIFITVKINFQHIKRNESTEKSRPFASSGCVRPSAAQRQCVETGDSSCPQWTPV